MIGAETSSTFQTTFLDFPLLEVKRDEHQICSRYHSEIQRRKISLSSNVVNLSVFKPRTLNNVKMGNSDQKSVAAGLRPFTEVDGVSETV
jgi:hypothetical protein